MSLESLDQIEQLCRTVYEGRDPRQISAAQEQLMRLGESLECIKQCQAILDGSSYPPAIQVATVSLTQLITEHWTSFTEEQRVQIRDYILNYLATNGPDMENYVVASMIQLLCRITKLGWFDENEHIRQITSDASAFFEQTPAHCVIGLRILNELVDEMNHRSKRRTITQNRKIAVSFRDQCLLNVFEMALRVLQRIASRASAGVNPELEDAMLSFGLSLTKRCLEYDFIGTNPDEASEEVGTIQVPSSWRDRIQNSTTVRLFFALYQFVTSFM